MLRLERETTCDVISVADRAWTALLCRSQHTFSDRASVHTSVDDAQ